MITSSTTAEDRLARLGIHLPDAPTPFGAYVPAVQTGNLLFLSGMLATSGHTATVVGVVGKDLDVTAGREAAFTAVLNVIALTKKQLGSLNRVSHVVRLGVYVAATPEFTEHARCIPSRPAWPECGMTSNWSCSQSPRYAQALSLRTRPNPNHRPRSH